MITKRFKTQAKALGQYGRQIVGKTIKRDRRKLLSFATKDLKTWNKIPKSATIF